MIMPEDIESFFADVYAQDTWIPSDDELEAMFKVWQAEHGSDEIEVDSSDES
jgi:hypothetical protein